MEIKKSLKSLKHLYHSPNCINCSQPLDNIVFNIEEGKIQCPICNFKHDPTELYSNGEIINLAELLIPDEREQFLSKVGFKRKATRRTSKFALVFFIVLMTIGAMITVATIDINFVLRILVGLICVTLGLWQICRYYKEEEKPKWHKERITSA